MASSFLPYGRQAIDDADVAAVAAALRTDYLTTGPLVAKFEDAFAQASGAGNAVASNSGTAALHLATMGIGLGPGDIAIVPTVTFLATANSVRMTGAEVVFADVDPSSGLLTPETLEDAIVRARAQGGRLRAVLPVHLNGQVCDMPAIARVARANDLSVIEDACHALGVPDIGACHHSDAACFSTHPVKAIATGEGGVTTTSDVDLARRMRELRSHGIVRDAGRFERRDLGFDGDAVNPWYHEMHEFSWNYRMPDILCALGISQISKLNSFQRRRREIAATYERALKPLAPRLVPVTGKDALSGWHLYAVRIDFDAIGRHRAELMRSLQERGIGTQVHYVPVHMQPYYTRRYGEINLPGSSAYYARCLSIPFYPTLTDGDVGRVCEGFQAELS